MNKNFKITKGFYIVLFILQINWINAQTTKELLTSDKDGEIEKSYFKFSNSFLTNDVYNGRQDSIVKPYLKPSITYYNKSGISTSFTGYYLTLANQKRFDYFSFDLEYNYNPITNLEIGFSANKTFYNKSSTAINSSIPGSLGVNLSYDFGFIEIMTDGNLLFSQKKDFGLDIELLHEFNIGEEDPKFHIAPTFDIEFNTLNYYEGYRNRKINKKKGKNNSNIASITSQVFVNNNHFSLLAYEASIPLTYEINHFVLFAIPTLAIPLTPIYTTTLTTSKSQNGVLTTKSKDSTPISEYNLKNKFYAEIGLYYKL